MKIPSKLNLRNRRFSHFDIKSIKNILFKTNIKLKYNLCVQSKNENKACSRNNNTTRSPLNCYTWTCRTLYQNLYMKTNISLPFCVRNINIKVLYIYDIKEFSIIF